MPIVKWSIFFIARELLVAIEIMQYFCGFLGKYMTILFPVQFYIWIFMYNFGMAPPYLQKWKTIVKMSTIDG